jgi:hypothetical protein
MRFEIGPGGMLLILLGLAGLSGAVFGLGLVAGHELSGPEPGSQPVAAAYPLPSGGPASAPSAAAEEASAPAPPAPANAGAVAAPGAETAVSSTNPAAINPPPKPAVVTEPPIKAAAPAPVAATRPIRKGTTSNTALTSRATRTSAAPSADEDLSTGAAVAPPAESGSEPAGSAATDEDEGEEERAPAVAQPPRRRLATVNPAPKRPSSGPYSVQIDAMMDRSGAEQMAQKMRAKGFEPYIEPTQVEGKTWYRLRVGHYSTPEQAQAAESKLHQEFDSAGN